MGNLAYTIMMIGVFVGLALLLRTIQYLVDRYRYGVGDPEFRSTQSFDLGRPVSQRFSGRRYDRW